MLTALIITAALALLVCVALAVVLVQAVRLRPAPRLTTRTVVIHTRQPDDQSIRGIVHGHYADRWTLREASLVTPVGEQPLGGLQHVPTGSVSWIQELQPTAEGGETR